MTSSLYYIPIGQQVFHKLMLCERRNYLYQAAVQPSNVSFYGIFLKIALKYSLTILAFSYHEICGSASEVSFCNTTSVGAGTLV